MHTVFHGPSFKPSRHERQSKRLFFCKGLWWPDALYKRFCQETIQVRLFLNAALNFFTYGSNRMLEDPAFQSVVSWGPQGDCFVVKVRSDVVESNFLILIFASRTWTSLQSPFFPECLNTPTLLPSYGNLTSTIFTRWRTPTIINLENM